MYVILFGDTLNGILSEVMSR